MAYNTGNPIGSSSPKDLSDNAQNLDLLLLGDKPTYPDRKSTPRKSWMGLEEEFNLSQSERNKDYTDDKLERDAKFSEGQDDRITEFNQFLESSGYEPPFDYTPGVSITRLTQQTRYLGELYRAKSSAIPFVTTTFVAEADKWISNGDNSLRQVLADPAKPEHGLAKIGYRGRTARESMDARTTNLDWGIKSSLSVPIDDVLDLMRAELSGTGYIVKFLRGNYRITRPHMLWGFTLELLAGAEIEVYGDNGTLFTNGAVQVDGKGELIGDGVVYTNGTMLPVSGSSAVKQFAGGRVKGVTVYSQLDECVNHRAGDIEVTVVGGHTRGLRSMLEVDAPIKYRVAWRNVGNRHINKLPVGVTAPDSRAFHIYPQIEIKSAVRPVVDGKYSWKNGAWLGGGLFPMHDLIVYGSVARAGYYLNAAGVEAFGHGAGTCIEIENCPDAVVTAETFDPAGYNVAIVNGSHRARVIGGGHYQGPTGDPVIVVGNSDDVIISSLTEGGTAGVSIGEAGTANNCRILNHIFNNHRSYPFILSNGNKLTVAGCTIKGEPDLPSAAGSWTGPGEIRAAGAVTRFGNDVEFTGNTLSGWFTHDVIDLGSSGRLRLTRNNNNYSAPILARDDVGVAPLHKRTTGGSPLLRVCQGDVDTTGYAGLSEVTILKGAAQQYTFFDLNTALHDVTTMAGEGEVLDDILSRYAVLMYIRYEAAAKNLRVSGGITSGVNASNTGFIFYSPYGTGVMAENSISGMLHPLVDGQEWVPLVVSLKEAIYSAADKTNLNKFFIRKLDSPELYDLHITKPVLFYIGDKQRAL